MTWAPLEIQKKLYEILTADSTLTALLASSTSVFDFVPQETAYPFIVIGELNNKDRGSHTTDGFETELTLHVWDRNTGRKKILDILKRVDDLLHNTVWSISGQTEVGIRRSTLNVIVEPDSVTYHGISSFKILTQEV